MEERVYINNQEGLRLVGVLHIPEHKKRTGIIICHGFSGNKDRNFIPNLASDLEKNNFLVLRFDFSGNGESDGKFEDRTYTKYVEDLRSVIEWFKRRVEEICVIGHSMGGSIALIEYSNYKNYDKLVLLAPAVKIIKKRFTKEYIKKLEEQGYIEFVNSWGEKRRLKKEFFDDKERYDQLELAKRLDIPTLIIIGDNDKTVSLQKCKKLFQIIPTNKKELKVLSNENHVFHNESSRILKLVLKFLE